MKGSNRDSKPPPVWIGRMLGHCKWAGKCLPTETEREKAGVERMLACIPGAMILRFRVMRTLRNRTGTTIFLTEEFAGCGEASLVTFVRQGRKIAVKGKLGFRLSLLGSVWSESFRSRMTRLHGGIKAREIMYWWYMAFSKFNPLDKEASLCTSIS